MFVEMDWYLLIRTISLLIFQLLGTTQTHELSSSHLAQYDQSASSSSFGEPVFRLEPPNVINFSNTKGVTILCLASGNPQPKISWYSGSSGIEMALQQTSFSGEISLEQTRPAENVTNLRLVVQNGAAIRLLPFKEADFRQDIHSTEYRCVANNHLATIHSRSVLVQAVMSSEESMEVKVNDEFVALNSVAVLKCRPNGSGPEFSQLIEWFTSDKLQIWAGETSKGNKFTAFKSGELHVNNVDINDLQRTYGCRLKNSITNRVVSSSGLAQLIVTNNIGPNDKDARNELSAVQFQQPQVLHSVSQLIAMDSLIQLQLHRISSKHLDPSQQHFEASSTPLSNAPPETAHTTESSLSDWRLLLPCAIRPSIPPNELRWFFQPAQLNDKKATQIQESIPLEQWASLKSIVIVNQTNQTHHHHHQASAVNSTASNGKRVKVGLHFGANNERPTTRFILGQTYLAIEWPTRAQSGRYICQLASNFATGKTMCDINVIIRQPIKLRVEATLSGADASDFSSSMAQSSSVTIGIDQEPNTEQQASWLSLAAGWFGWPTTDVSGNRDLKVAVDNNNDVQPRRRRRSRSRRNLFYAKNIASASMNPLLDGDTHRVQVRGQGYISPPPIVNVGHRLQLDCYGSGHPIESIKWFKNGKVINTQSSNDFQVEITSPSMGLHASQTSDQMTGSGDISTETSQTSGNGEILLSSLIIRQVQPKDAGLLMFECFAYNSLGDRARAGLPVFVSERHLIEWARSVCPIQPQQQQQDRAISRTGLQDDSNNNIKFDYELEADEFEWAQREGRRASVIFKRHNPFLHSLLLEAEPVELLCPTTSSSLRRLHSNVSLRVDWRRWSTPASAAAPPQPAAAAVAPVATGTSIEGRQQMTESQARNFNQLFSGDSRFVINGSSLQIRSPSKRHDEAVYVCRLTQTTESQQQAQVHGQEQQHEHEGARAATSGKLDLYHQSGAHEDEPPADSSRVGDSSSRSTMLAVHQSSLASSSPSCSSLLASTLFRGQEQRVHHNDGGQAPMSSISIRIVDPFEFSRNLEEGMRAVAVCAVISGQSPIEITWFKNGELLIADDQMSVDQANGFSSTLTFHRIRPTHSGLYTCVAANAFAATNHTSRLIVNVAPYFIDPPKNTRAVLNTNVLVNCQAGGQPNPQIRWRKLVPIGSGVNSKLVAPPNGSPALILNNKLLESYDQNEQTIFDFQQSAQMAPPTQPPISAGLSLNKLEFRIITSNSHIQVLENGSMIIKDVELSDSSRYICQAFNGINPSLSEVIDLVVLSPASFEINYETVSVKRDAMVKFNCAPKGDQPMRIDWYKENHLLVANNSSSSGFQVLDNNKLQQQQQQQPQSKYSEVAYFAATGDQQRRNNLIPQQKQQLHTWTNNNRSANNNVIESQNEVLKSSELFINYADRGDTGTFVCVARNAYGKDELTYRLVVQELPDVPTQVSVQNVQANSLKLTWYSPFDGNLAISHFVIEYRKTSHSIKELSSLPESRHNEWIRLVVSTSKLNSDSSVSLSSSSASLQTHPNPSTLANNSGGNQQQTSYSIVLRQLSPKSTYHIRVAAVNAIGQSEFSSHLSVSTAEEPPTSRPNDLRAQPMSSSSIKVLWRAPAIVEEQAPIKGYYISHRKFQTVAVGKDEHPAPAATVANSQLWLASSSISAANVTYHSLDESLIGNNPKSFNSRNSVISGGAGDDYEFTLSMLEKNTKYEIRVQPYNSMGVGPASDTIGQTLKFDRPGQPNLKLVAAHRQSFELKWTVSDEQPLMGFSIFYKCEYDDWQEIQLGIIYHYVIENLRCGNKYQIYLSAFNVVGRSDPSDVLSVRTEGTVPVAPDKSQFFRSNITELVLDMSGWQSGGCPISSFMIQFKRLHDSNWFILSEGATPFANSDKITIPDLTPATWYKLLVTALNEAGSTNAEYLFSTLNNNGEEIAPAFPLDHDTGQQQPGWLMGGASGGRSMLSGLNQLLFSSSSSSSSSSSTNKHNNDGQLLLPMSCILLLLVTSLASYLYYTRSASAAAAANSLARIGETGSPRTLKGQRQCNGQPIGRSSSLLMNQLQSCDSATTTLARGAMDEKHLTHQTNGHHLHHLINANSLPLDAGHRSQDANQQSDDQANHLVLDSLMTNSGLHSFVGSNGNPNRAQRAHAMKLLSSGNIFANSNLTNSNCTNSSVSTNSTNCFDGSSSQASSSGTSGGGGARAKLQLIDESSMISGAIDETLEENRLHWQQQQQFIYGNQTCSSSINNNNNNSNNKNSSVSPARTIYSGLRSAHVDVINDGQPSEQRLTSNQLIDTNLNNLFNSDAENQNRLYGSSNQRLLSTSFASAADLLQRQQQQMYYQQLQQAEEPIYQRLDKFQAYGLPVSKQQQFALNHAKSQTLRFNSHSSMDDSLKSLTIQRGQYQQQQPPQQQIDEQQFLNGFYPHQQSIQIQPVSYADQSYETAANNSEIDHQRIIYNNQQQ